MFSFSKSTAAKMKHSFTLLEMQIDMTNAIDMLTIVRFLIIC